MWYLVPMLAELYHGVSRLLQNRVIDSEDATDTEGALRIRETYELKEDGEELQVSIVFENNRTGLRVRFRRVYNVQQAMESSHPVDTTP